MSEQHAALALTVAAVVAMPLSVWAAVQHHSGRGRAVRAVSRRRRHE
ncbi:hypothetical protein [Streptomyces sp. CRN 30]|nr:hypothetical protein [Streptomyces sp. CRN 30]